MSKKPKTSSTLIVVPDDLVSWADGKLSDDKKKTAEILADFIISNKKFAILGKDKKVIEIELEKSDLTKNYVKNRDLCVKLFKIMLARIEGWTYIGKKNKVIQLCDGFYDECSAHIKDDTLIKETLKHDKGFATHLLERVIQMQFCYLYAIRLGAKKESYDDSTDEFKSAIKEAKGIYNNADSNDNIEGLKGLISNYRGDGSIFKVIHTVKDIRNEIHDESLPDDERATVFQYYIFALFLFSVAEMFLETQRNEHIRIQVILRKDQKGYNKLKISGSKEGKLISGSPFNKSIFPNQQYSVSLCEGQYEFTATCDKDVEKKTCTVERGSWIRNPQLIIIDFNKPGEPEGTTPPPPPPPNKNRDESSFADYKEEQRKELLKKYGIKISEDKLKMISSLSYSEEKSLAGNKAAVDSLVIKIESQLVMENNPWRKIGYLIKEGLSWVDKHWQWCAGALCLIVIPVVLMSIFDGGNSVEISDGQAVPSLQGTWRVRLMEGQNVNEGATITQAGENNTQYNISIIRNDIPDDSPNMDYKFETALSVDWQKGIVTSPDLGEGTIEKESRSKNLKIVFDKWIFVSLKGY